MNLLINPRKKKKLNTRLWDLNIPSDLLQEILSRLRLKDNIKASLVCKTWFESAVSVRKSHPLPWLFYPKTESQDYILFDQSKSKKYTLKYPELKDNEISCSKDGWLLMLTNCPSKLVFFLNPFTRDRINLPERSQDFLLDNFLSFSAAPTSTSCLVFSFSYTTCRNYFVIATWRPSETEWTIHRFENNVFSSGIWFQCVFANDVFYCLSKCGYLAVFDPSRATWSILPTKPWTNSAFCQIDFGKGGVLMMEHEGDIFVMNMRINNPQVFKLNLKLNLWEEKKSEVGGLTIFASFFGTFTRAGFHAEERSRIYFSIKGRFRAYYSIGDESLIRSTDLSKHVAWVDPPHNNFNL